MSYVIRALTAILVLGLFVLVGAAGLFYGLGQGIDRQRAEDQRNICRAYSRPEAITGFHCGPVVFAQP